MWPVHITEGSEFAELFCLKWALCPFDTLDIWDFIEKSWFSCSYVLWQGSQAEGDRMHLLLHHTREEWLCVPSKAWETEIATTLYCFLEKKKEEKRKRERKEKEESNSFCQAPHKSFPFSIQLMLTEPRQYGAIITYRGHWGRDTKQFDQGETAMKGRRLQTNKQERARATVMRMYCVCQIVKRLMKGNN